jgi:hypothetical protein
VIATALVRKLSLFTSGSDCSRQTGGEDNQEKSVWAIGQIVCYGFMYVCFLPLHTSPFPPLPTPSEKEFLSLKLSGPKAAHLNRVEKEVEEAILEHSLG